MSKFFVIFYMYFYYVTLYHVFLSNYIEKEMSIDFSLCPKVAVLVLILTHLRYQRKLI